MTALAPLPLDAHYVTRNGYSLFVLNGKLAHAYSLMKMCREAGVPPLQYEQAIRVEVSNAYFDSLQEHYSNKAAGGI